MTVKRLPIPTSLSLSGLKQAREILSDSQDIVITLIISESDEATANKLLGSFPIEIAILSEYFIKDGAWALVGYNGNIVISEAV